MLLAHTMHSIVCSFENFMSLATGCDLKVLKWNFLKRMFIAALWSSPKSISNWHVMNIGHRMVSGVDDLYFLSCAVKPPLVSTLRPKR